MAQPGFHSLVIYRGDTAAWDFALWQDAQRSEPVQLAGFTPAAEIRNAPGGSIVMPLTIAVTAPNELHLSLTSAQTQQLCGGVWDLRLTDNGDGSVQTVLRGNVFVTANVTGSA